MAKEDKITISGILVSLVAPMADHIANGGEKLLGNASSIKQRPDGRVYISGQMQRHALFSAIERLNLVDSKREATYVSNGDGVTNEVERDLRSDLGGFLHTSKGDYSGRRTAPLTATPAVAMKESSVGRDLLIRLKMNTGGERDQALATKEFSQDDSMLMSFFIDVGSVSISKKFNYKDELHIETEYVKHVKEEERKRRVKLALEATRSLTDYANQARNAISGEPQRVLIVFDTKLSRKGARYFQSEETEQKNIIAELSKRGAKYFFGDDTGKADSVDTAYEKALTFLETNALYDPTNNGKPVPFEKAFG